MPAGHTGGRLLSQEENSHDGPAGLVRGRSLRLHPGPRGLDEDEEDWDDEDFEDDDWDADEDDDEDDDEDEVGSWGDGEDDDYGSRRTPRPVLD